MIDKQGSGRRREGSYDLTLRRIDPAAQCSLYYLTVCKKVGPPSSGQDWNRAQLTISEVVNVEELEKMAEIAHTTNGKTKERVSKECKTWQRREGVDKTSSCIGAQEDRREERRKMLVPVERERKRRGVAKQNRNKSRRRRSSTYTRLCPRKIR